MPTKQQVEKWVAAYVRAWRSNASEDIAALFWRRRLRQP